MGNNILSAILNIVGFRNNDLRNYASKYLIRINAAGEQLEFFVKDSLSGSFTKRQEQKEAEYSKAFSYLGNQNNPPDAILKNGDAFEIKKIESPKSTLALNSSPPKDRLYSSDKRILQSCRECDGGSWKEKDLFYVVGHAKGGILKYLFFAHGLCYAAEKEVYERVHEPLKKEISSILKSGNLEAAETIELGKVKRVDPLGITELRIRGMWSIQNPINVFKHVCPFDPAKEFSLFALVKKSKYDSFPKDDIAAIERKNGIEVKDVKIKDPNNLAKQIDAKLIRAMW